jgi:putative aldouronate transport system permease protein
MGKKETKAPAVHKKPLSLRIWNYRGFYLMFIPVFIFVLIIYYWPMLGVRYSFYSYKLRDIHWVGLGNFVKLFGEKEFWSSFKNTLIISIVKLLLNTFVAVLIAIFLN